MSAQSLDDTVNKVTPVLFRRYPTPEALAAANPQDVEAIIHPTGFFRQKTKSIISTSQQLVEDFAGQVPDSIEELTTLRGVARKTANVVISNAWPAKAQGIFVDTHIRRVSQRLAWTPNEDPVKIERDLMALLPKRAWVDVPHQLIYLGREFCDAQRPRHAECPLLKWCPTGQAALASPARLGSPTTIRRASGSPKAKKRR